jgi:GrpB-like predicted nucleotidyltransferase (UPF0157 family)
MILGLARGSVQLVPHQIGWHQAFESERRQLESALGVSARKIEHVGSTAVPDLVAKPIIDIAIAVDSFDQIRAWSQALAVHGYAYFGDRYGWKDHFFAKGPDALRTFYLHVVEETGARWRNYLLFRDRMRASPELRQEYQSLKLAAAEAKTTRDAYTAAKEDFIIKVLGTRDRK